MPRDGWFDGRGLDLVNCTKEALKEKWDLFLRDGVILADERVKLRQEIYSDLKMIEPRLDEALHRELTSILVKYEMLVELHQTKGC